MIKLCLWILNKMHLEVFVTPPGVVPIIRKAEEMCRVMEWKMKDASGEAKRHQIYAELIKRLPEAEKRDIALAIELAVRSVPR